MRDVFNRDEPKQGIDEDNDAFSHRLLAWARTEMPKRDKRIADLLTETTVLKRDLDDKTVLIESYRKVQDAADRIRIYEVGDTVYIGPDHIEARVHAVKLCQGRQVKYFVGWWKDGYNTATFPSDEIEGDAPLARS